MSPASTPSVRLWSAADHASLFHVSPPTGAARPPPSPAPAAARRVAGAAAAADRGRPTAACRAASPAAAPRSPSAALPPGARGRGRRRRESRLGQQPETDHRRRRRTRRHCARRCAYGPARRSSGGPPIGRNRRGFGGARHRQVDRQRRPENGTRQRPARRPDGGKRAAVTAKPVPASVRATIRPSSCGDVPAARRGHRQRQRVGHDPGMTEPGGASSRPIRP